MKVVYIGNFDPRETGGTRRAYEVIRRIHRYGIDPYMFHVKSVPNDLLTRIGALRSLKETVAIIKNANEINKLGIELVVATSESPSPVMIAHYFAKKFDRPWTVVMQLPVKLKYTPASTNPIITDPLWLPQQLWVLNLLKKIIVLTVSPSCILESTIKLPRYMVIKPGVGIDYKLFDNINVSNITYDGIFMARLTPEKGLYDIVKIWRKVTEEMPKAKLAIAGRFENNRIAFKFFRLLDKYDLREKIVYLGYLSEERKIVTLKSSKVFIYPSKLDAYPIVILEALASKLPVIAYDIPAIRFNYPLRTVLRAPVGSIEYFAGKVIEVLEGYDEWRKLAVRENTKFIEPHDWDNVVRAEAGLYKRIVRIFTGRSDS